MQSVTDGNNNSAVYAYLANSPLIQQITFNQGANARMTTSRQYDYLNRLTQIASVPGAGFPVSFNYTYKSANQRVLSHLADGSYWRYQYDSLGQVTSGHKYFSDETPVAGQQFDYGFDNIGNRTQAEAGGDQNGANQRSASYTANNLNQYTQRTVPGYVDVMGLGLATGSVTANGYTAYRKGEYFREQLSVANSTIPVWEGLSVAESGQATITGNAYVPQTPEQFTYDADGNLTSDGRWYYGWDAENRLVNLTNKTSVGPQQVIRFEYDARGRRIQKQVWGNSQGSGSPTNDVEFVYDGWNLVGELTTAHASVRTYLWGVDLSGSVRGAGGVGGLLEVVYYGSTTTNSFVAFDGNGNVAALVNAADGTAVAQYEYGPFGEVLRTTGPMARANPLRFSSKYEDDETDLLYYGYRYYNASSGRWLNRDFIQDSQNCSPYCFVFNQPIAKQDVLGLSSTFYATVDRRYGVKVSPGRFAETWIASQFYGASAPQPCGSGRVKVTDVLVVIHIVEAFMAKDEESTFVQVQPGVWINELDHENQHASFLIQRAFQMYVGLNMLYNACVCRPCYDTWNNDYMPALSVYTQALSDYENDSLDCQAGNAKACDQVVPDWEKVTDAQRRLKWAGLRYMQACGR